MGNRLLSEVVRACDDELTPRGFYRTAKNWRLDRDDTILVIDLQKSDWAKEYFVNLGVMVKRLSDNPAPKIPECHIVERLDALVEMTTDKDENLPPRLREMLRDPNHSLDLSLLQPSDLEWLKKARPPIAAALDLHNADMRAEQRQRILRDSLRKYAIPFLFKLDSVSKIRAALERNALRGAAVWKVVYQECGVPFKE